MRRKMAKIGMGGVAVLAAGIAHNQAALAAMQLYYLREMVAALLLFSIGFAVLIVVILLLLLVELGLHRTLVWTEPSTAYPALRVHQGWVQLEQFGRKQFHRFE